MDDLPLEIAQFHSVVVDKAETTDTCSGEVERCGRAQAASTHNEHTGLIQPALTLIAHVGQAEVAGMTGNATMVRPPRLPTSRKRRQWTFSSSHFSTSMAAEHPKPAAVMACL